MHIFIYINESFHDDFYLLIFLTSHNFFDLIDKLFKIDRLLLRLNGHVS